MADRLRYRGPAPRVEIRYRPDEAGIRRAALLRLLAPRARHAFVADPDVAPAAIRVEGLTVACATAPTGVCWNCRPSLTA
jgi:hypothetical protein